MKQALLALAFLAGISLQAQITTTNTYYQSVDSGIPPGNPNGTNSVITVSGVFGNIQSLTVSLDITNGYNGDLFAYLSGPNGGYAVLLNRTGVDSTNPFGYGDSGMDVTFTLDATNIHFYQDSSYTLNSGGQLTGVWAPDGRAVDPATNGAVLAATPSTASLDSFVGTNPNGDWYLYVADMANEIQANWVSWQITVVTVPEPATLSLFAAGAIGLGIFLRKKNRV